MFQKRVLRKNSLIFLFLGITAVLSTAEYSGVLDKNTTWEGKIVVRGDLLVPEGKTLRIRAGTVVYFANSEVPSQSFKKKLKDAELDFGFGQHVEVAIAFGDDFAAMAHCYRFANEFIPIDVMAFKLGAIHAGELHLPADHDAAPAAHPRPVDHNRVERGDGVDLRGPGDRVGDIQVNSNGNGTGGPGYSFEDELDDERTYSRGIVAMANSGPNTNGSQFFIMLGNTPLPKNYTIFGKVVEGMDVVDKIQVGDEIIKVTVESM